MARKSDQPRWAPATVSQSGWFLPIELPWMARLSVQLTKLSIVVIQQQQQQHPEAEPSLLFTITSDSPTKEGLALYIDYIGTTDGPRRKHSTQAKRSVHLSLYFTSLHLTSSYRHTNTHWPGGNIQIDRSFWGCERQLVESHKLEGRTRTTTTTT